MTPTELLELEVSLMLLRYGRASLLKALADRINAPVQDLEREMARIRSAQLVRNAKKTAARPFDADAFFSRYPEKTDELKTLFLRFENRVFLPELKDVKKLFDRHHKPLAKPKSRALIARQLFQFLAELPVSELRSLCSEEPIMPGTSSLGIISDEILRNSRSAIKKQ